jgi:hypothetical protein
VIRICCRQLVRKETDHRLSRPYPHVWSSIGDGSKNASGEGQLYGLADSASRKHGSSMASTPSSSTSRIWSKKRRSGGGS